MCADSDLLPGFSPLTSDHTTRTDMTITYFDDSELPTRAPSRTDSVTKKQDPNVAEQDVAQSSEKLKTGAPSIDGRTLNDPDLLLKEEREATRTAIHEPTGKEDDFPDGGLRAWLVVFGVSSISRRVPPI